MKVSLIPIVIGALSTITKGLVQGLEELEIRGRIETIQTMALGTLVDLVSVWKNSNPIYQPLRSGRIWHKVNF